MKAMIFAAGLGTRLRPLTDTKPKALIEVGGKPMLGHVIDKLIIAGVGRFVINVHHFPRLIIDYVTRSYPDINVVFSDESTELLDTGGGILAALPLLGDSDEPVIVHNADILTDFSIPDMLAAHFASGADATLLVDDRKSSRKLLFDSDSRLHGWVNTSTGVTIPPVLPIVGLHPLAFGGVHILSQSLLKALPSYGERVFSITPFFVAMAEKLNIQAYTPREPYGWFDIGSPEKLAAARASSLALPRP